MEYGPDPQLRGSEPQPDGRYIADGQQYAIPLLYGLAIPIYRADLYTPKENSYSILFDEDLAGRVTWTDSAEWFVVAASCPRTTWPTRWIRPMKNWTAWSSS